MILKSFLLIRLRIRKVICTKIFGGYLNPWRLETPFLNRLFGYFTSIPPITLSHPQLRSERYYVKVPYVKSQITSTN